MRYAFITSESPEGQAAKQAAKRMARALWTNRDEGMKPEIVIAALALHIALTGRTICEEPHAFVDQVASVAKLILDTSQTKQ